MTALGRYTVDTLIGEGAMAEVYRAHDPAIGRTVAIKVLKPEYDRDPAIGARFLREARAAGALSHANIATIYEAGEADGTPYIAMELVDGQPLDSALQAGGRMPYERVLALAIQLADALDYAHRAGVVHRDVKPSNILLSTDGRTVKLLDFGVARVGDAVAEQQMAKTQAGQLIGTPRYMSPEQALGLPAEARSDLFSLGAVLYEMITGKVAFAGPGLATLAMQIAQEPVEPIERSAADCPPGLRFIINKLLAKKLDQRFTDAAQVVRALQRERDDAHAEPVKPPRGLPLKVKLPLMLVTVTALALAISVFTMLDRQRATLENMAIVSGKSIAAFVTSNAAVRVADNAGLPAAEQDWAPLQAFVSTAAKEDGVLALAVADEHGVIRAAADSQRVGHRYQLSTNERVESVPGGIRFVRPIHYAGARFGTVDLVLDRTALDAAIDNARALLVMLAAIVMTVVAIVGYLSATIVARPIRKLLRVLDEAAKTGLSLRISHRRGDEFGAVFDGFNRMAAALEPRLNGDTRNEEAAAKATCISTPSKMAA